MNTQIKNLKTEKFTFITIICILLFSLIYMSMYSIMMKNKIENFREEIEAINNEINILTEVMPVKDSTIEHQKERIALQLQELREVIAKNEISEKDNQMLRSKLKVLKTQLVILKNQTKQAIRTNPDAVYAQENSTRYILTHQPDTLLAAKEKEIIRLRNMIDHLIATKPEVSVSNKLSAYYFVVLSSDKKNRSARTDFLTIQLQLKGDLPNFGNENLRIEVRDPSNSIISSNKDKIKPSNHYIINYKFEPYSHKFIKGKYSIRIYSEDTEFQSVTFLTLV